MSIRIQEKNLKNYNTMAINSVCHSFYIARSYQDIINIYNDHPAKKIVLLGGGSNIILSKNYYDDKYIFISTQLLADIEDVGASIKVQCGATLSKLAWYMLEKECKGYEFIEDIPGTVGGAVFMNAGTNQGSISEYITSVTWYDKVQNQIFTERSSHDWFGYRESKFNDGNSIILEVEFRKTAGEYLTILDNMLETKKSRYLKQPRNYPNAGSVFKRNYNSEGQPYHIWKLLDEVDLRGFSVGNAMVSEKHPGFIINTDNCSGDDILTLIEIIKDKISEKFKIKLESEWKII